MALNNPQGLISHYNKVECSIRDLSKRNLRMILEVEKWSARILKVHCFTFFKEWYNILSKWKKKQEILFNFWLSRKMQKHEIVFLTRWLGWFVGFYGISTFVGYLTPNPFLYKSVLFKTIQFSISTQFNCQKHFHF